LRGSYLSLEDSGKLFFEVQEIVRSEFQPKDSYLHGSTPTFIIPYSPQISSQVESLRDKLRSKGLWIILRRVEDNVVLQVVPLPKQAQPSRGFFRSKLSLILFIATIITVTISGYLTSQSYITVLQSVASYNGKPQPSGNTYLFELTALYAVAIMAIVGLHELGHTLACRRHRINASMPTFIPGIPGVTPGTFGAVIMQREPTMNRNQLFDIGLAGPLVGFIVSVIVSIIGYSLSIPVSQAEYQYVVSGLGGSQSLLPPVLIMLLGHYILPGSANTFTYFMHPLALAGWMGTLITFLNIFPIGQLDGGHVSMAILGAKWHKILSYAMMVVMVLIGWWAMAFLVVFLISARHPGTLDNVSALSRNRKIIGIILIVVIFVCCFTLSPDSLLWPLFFK
jgi:membrane-associated protease RseP (regulator of RpoE activity)